MALSDLIDIRVEFGLGAAGETGSLWDTALWDEGTWSSSEIQWTDLTGSVQGFTTRSGKSVAVSAILKRNRTATAIFTMDNTLGSFIPGADIPGFLDLRPGRYVRVLGRPIGSLEPGTETVPLPDGTTWTDSTGRTWTAHGDGLQLTRETPPVPADWEPIWFGRIDTIDNKHDGGDLTALIKCTDAFADLAVNTQPAEPSQGAGDTAASRIERILFHAGWPLARQDITPGGYTMQATTLAGTALDLCGITTDSTGGDFWQKPDGVLAWRNQGWKSDTVAWIFGGVTGLPVHSATPTWSVFRIINESHFSRANGTEQVGSDSLSRQVYGRRTHTRLDLVNDQDVDVASLGTLVVTALKSDRVMLTAMSVLVQDADTAAFVTGVSIGDLIQATVDTMFGWSNTFLCHVVSIADDVTAEGWIMTLGLDDAVVKNQYGPYSRDEFSSAFHLGGPEDA